MLVDSHAHLDSDRYHGELLDVLKRARAAGVETILSIGIGEGPAEMQNALGICREFNQHPDSPAHLPRLFASAGIYPHNAHEADTEAMDKLNGLLAEPEVIACGEIGLDYYHEGAARETQKAVFVQQMEIAAAHGRPILIHCRPRDGDNSCWDNTLDLLAAHWRTTGLGGILHCFSGQWSHAERAMELGFLISFAGHLTYPRSQQLRDVAARVPLNLALVETDAPFLAPIPNRGKRNEPAFVADTAQALGLIRGKDSEEIAEVTTKNFERLFGLAPNV